jgi:thiamine-phosphate pyrophosphorylase
MRGIYFILTVTDPQKDLLLLKHVALSGISAVQLRAKSGIDLTTARAMSRLCEKHRILFIVNDDVDLALCIGADGVHLGQTDMPLFKARALLGNQMIIGSTAPTPELIKKAEKEGANYVGVGHVLPTTTKKKDGPPIGIEGIEVAVKAAQLPVVAIGGLHAGILPALKQAGASAAAICAAIKYAANPRQSAESLVRAWHA